MSNISTRRTLYDVTNQLKATEMISIRQQVQIGIQRRDVQFLKQIFQKFQDTDSNLILKENLRSILTYLGLEGSETDIEEIFFTVDTNADGGLDFNEFQRAVSRPSSVEQWAGELPLAQLVADSMPRIKGQDPLRVVSEATEEQLENSCLAVAEVLLKLLQDKVSTLKDLYRIQEQAKPNLAAAKFEVSKISSGQMKDYYAGLAGRIGRTIS